MTARPTTKETRLLERATMTSSGMCLNSIIIRRTPRHHDFGKGFAVVLFDDCILMMMRRNLSGEQTSQKHLSFLIFKA